MPNRSDSRQELRRQLDSLTTESVDSSRPDLDLLTTADLVRLMNAEDQRVAPAVGREADAIVLAIDLIVHHFRQGGRLVYLGAGTAGRLGILDASECPPTFGTPPEQVVGLIAGGTPAIQQAVEFSEDDESTAVDQLTRLNLGAADVVVGISASGRTPYVAAGLTHARSVGAATICLTSNRHSVLSTLSDIAIEVVVGPEFVSGSTRLKAGTAQKLVLNMLTTISMIKLGKTFHGVMVDLLATNEKLLARSENTVIRLTGADADTATHALEAAGGSVKLALAMLLTNASVDAAAAALAANDGVLRLAIQQLNTG